MFPGMLLKENGDRNDNAANDGYKTGDSRK